MQDEADREIKETSSGVEATATSTPPPAGEPQQVDAPRAEDEQETAEEQELVMITEPPDELRVFFLPSGSEPMNLTELAQKTTQPRLEERSARQRKLAQSVAGVWTAALAREDGPYLYDHSLTEVVVFEISDEADLEGSPEIREIELGEHNAIELSTCEHLAPNDAALCVDDCCHFRLMGGVSQASHSQLSLGRVCFDLSDETASSYRVRQVSVHVDQCEAGRPSFVNLDH